MANQMVMRAHGFVYPSNMPPCEQCRQTANTGPHVNPPRQGMTFGQRRMLAADQLPFRGPMRSHVYTAGRVGMVDAIRCAACGEGIAASNHPAGMPVGSMPSQRGSEEIDEGPEILPMDAKVVLVKHPFQPMEQDGDGDDDLCALCGFNNSDSLHIDGDSDDMPLVTVKSREAIAPPPELPTQRAFVANVDGKTILAAPARVFAEPDRSMPRELAAAWEKASAANPHFMWIEGRYVEADQANRNQAYWSSDDLQLGEPTIAHGPLNWLHEERHIIGTLAAAKLVAGNRQAASDKEERAHIRSLAAVWRYLYPEESHAIEHHSESGTLWYSMECVSREVACLEEGCQHTQSYAQYMQDPMSRCQHIKAGAARRFADPSFLGGAVIIPPVRPGWAGAHANVMRQAAALAEANEKALVGLAESDAVSVVAQIIRFAERS